MKKETSSAYDRNTLSFKQVKALLNSMYEPTVQVEVFMVRAKARVTLTLKDFYHTAENNTALLINTGIVADTRYLVTESPLLSLVQISNSEIIATLIGQPRRQTLWDAVDQINAKKEDKPARS